jgi:hypothetical protein
MTTADFATDGKTHCEYFIDSCLITDKSLLDDNLDILYSNGKYDCATFFYQGTIDSTLKLLNIGIDPNVVDKDGWTPIFMAIYSHNPKSVKMLIDAGADINISEEEHRTPLCMAIDIRDVKITNILLNCEDIVVDAISLKEAIYCCFDLNIVKKMLSKFLKNHRVEDMTWYGDDDWPMYIYTSASHDENVKLFELLVAAFPGLRNEIDERRTKLTCYNFLKKEFKSYVPDSEALEILHILRNPIYPTLFDILYLRLC